MSSAKEENESQKRTIAGVENEVVGEIEMVVEEEEGGTTMQFTTLQILYS